MTAEDEKRLTAILERTIGFVKYAEAKNGVVITLCAALIAGVLKSFADSHGTPSFFFVASIILLGCAVLISAWSFRPILEVDEATVSKFPDHKEPNPLFFGHIARLSPQDFLEELLRDGRTEWSHIELLYADQIVINSYITLVKLSKFKYAIVALVAGFLCLAIGEILAMT